MAHQSQRRAATDAFALLTGGVNSRFDTNKLHPATLAALTGGGGGGSSANGGSAKGGGGGGHAAANATANATSSGGSKRARKAAARAAAAAAAAAAGDANADSGDDRAGVAVFAPSQPSKRARTDELSAPLALPTAPRTNDPFEAANAARKAMRIRVAGGDAPPLLESFAALTAASGGGQGGASPSLPSVPQRVLDNVAAAGWDAPTPVQRQVVPALMRGREVFGIAPTGSGKTLAFALPIVGTLAAARRDWARRQREEREGERGEEGGKEGKGKGRSGGGSSSSARASKPAKQQQKDEAQAAAEEQQQRQQKQRKNAPPLYDPHNGPHALVLAPTAELAAQIGRVFERLTPGTGLRTCVLTAATAAGLDPGRVDVLVATPLRLVGLLPRGGGGGDGAGAGAGGGNKDKDKEGEKPQKAKGPATPAPAPTAATTDRKTLDLTRGLRFLVLDEADKLLSEEGGFVAQADAVLAAAGSRPWLARSLLSATLPERVEALARAALRDPLRVTVGERGAATASVDQRLLFVGQEEGKMPALRQLLLGNAAAVLGGGGGYGGGGGGGGDPLASPTNNGPSAPLPPPLIVPPILVFASTKERARLLHRDLVHEGGGRLRVDSITADQPNAARRAAVENFRLGRTWVLVATDLVGRGMDFVGVNTVVSYDFPRTGADYIHRVGRTGRAGRKGCAVTFFTEDDAPRLKAVASIVRAAGGVVPDWMTRLKAQRRRAPSSSEAVPAGGGGGGEWRQGGAWPGGGGGGGKGRGGGGGGGSDKKHKKHNSERSKEASRGPGAGRGGGVQKKHTTMMKKKPERK